MTHFFPPIYFTSQENIEKFLSLVDYEIYPQELMGEEFKTYLLADEVQMQKVLAKNHLIIEQLRLDLTLYLKPYNILAIGVHEFIKLSRTPDNTLLSTAVGEFERLEGSVQEQIVLLEPLFYAICGQEIRDCASYAANFIRAYFTQSKREPELSITKIIPPLLFSDFNFITKFSEAVIAHNEWKYLVHIPQECWYNKNYILYFASIIDQCKNKITLDAFLGYLPQKMQTFLCSTGMKIGEFREFLDMYFTKQSLALQIKSAKCVPYNCKKL